MLTPAQFHTCLAGSHPKLLTKHTSSMNSSSEPQLVSVSHANAISSHLYLYILLFGVCSDCYVSLLHAVKNTDRRVSCTKHSKPPILLYGISFCFSGHLWDRDQWDLWDPESLCQLQTDQPDGQARSFLTAGLHHSLQGQWPSLWEGSGAAS